VVPTQYSLLSAACLLPTHKGGNPKKKYGPFLSSDENEIVNCDDERETNLETQFLFLFLERETYFVCVAPNSNDIVVVS
jgi:hypothetical protein